MRRATLLLASSLAAAAIAGAFLYERDSPIDTLAAAPTPSTVEPVRSQAEQPPRAAPAETEPNVSAPASDSAAAEVARRDREAYERAVRRRGPPRDEATILAEKRTQLRQDVRQGYSLLLDDLDLTPQEREDLVAVLAELHLDSAWISERDSGYEKRGRTIGAKERHERIAAAIGERKLDEFLVLEVNLASYAEAQQIASLLGRKDAPITEAQRDRMLEILVEVRDRYPHESTDLDPRSVEWVEQQLVWMDDFDRHIVEMAPSVLSATQVAHLSDEYQWMARQRIDAVELQKNRRATRPGGSWAVPARWNPH